MTDPKEILTDETVVGGEYYACPECKITGYVNQRFGNLRPSFQDALKRGLSVSGNNEARLREAV